MKYILDNVNLRAAKEGKKEAIWADPDKYPDIDAHTAVRVDASGVCFLDHSNILEQSVQVVESELVDELRNSRGATSPPSYILMIFDSPAGD